MLDIPKFARSLKFAWNGIVLLARQEQSFRILLASTLVLIVLIVYFGLSRSEIALLSVVVALVLVLELLNGAVERLVDLFKPRIHEYAEEVKDLMAGAVLISAVAALVVAVIVFLPHVQEAFWY